MGAPIAVATAFVARFLVNFAVVFILLRNKLIVLFTLIAVIVVVIMTTERLARLFSNVLLGLGRRPSTTLAGSGVGHKRGCGSWSPRSRAVARHRRLHSTIWSVATMNCLLIAKTFPIVVIVVGHLLMVRVAIVRMEGRRKVMLPGISVVEAIAVTGQVVIFIVIVTLIPRGGAPRLVELDATRASRSPRPLVRTGRSGALGRGLLLDWLGLFGRLGLLGFSLNLLHDPVQGIGIDEVSPVAVPEPVPCTVLTHADVACDTAMEGARSPGIAPVALLDPTVLGIPLTVGAGGVLGERLE